MLVRFLQEWKHYMKDDEAVIEDGIATGLLTSGLAVNIGIKEETVDSIGYQKANLTRLRAWKEGVVKTLEMIDKQLAPLEAKEKAMESAPVDKMARRVAVSK